MPKKVASTRLDPQLLAKARDGLLSRGIPSENCEKVSQILRLTFLYGLTALCEQPLEPASKESTLLIKQKISQKMPRKDLELSDILSLQ